MTNVGGSIDGSWPQDSWLGFVQCPIGFKGHGQDLTMARGVLNLSLKKAGGTNSIAYFC